MSVDTESWEKDLVELGDHHFSLGWGKGGNTKQVAEGRPEDAMHCGP